VVTRTQITVFLENKPGRLAKILSELARQKVNIVALAVMDHSEQTVLRLVPEDEALAATVFQGSHISFTEAEILAVELKNQPGSLAHVCEVLAAEHINIEYAYCSSGGRNGKVFGIFKVSNIEKAQKVLAAGAKSRKPERRALRDQRTYKGAR
jgi:hypothetical protein